MSEHGDNSPTGWAEWSKTLRPESATPQIYRDIVAHREFKFAGEPEGTVNSQLLLAEILKYDPKKFERRIFEFEKPKDIDRETMTRLLEEPNENFNTFGKLLHQHIKGNHFVDIAAGSQYHILARIAQMLGAKEYVGNDIAFKKSKIEQKEGFRMITDSSDMLLFLSRLPDNFAGITFMGPMGVPTNTEWLQRYIEAKYPPRSEHYLTLTDKIRKDPRVSADLERRRVYRESMAKEMARVTRQNGLIILSHHNRGDYIFDHSFPKDQFKSLSPKLETDPELLAHPQFVEPEFDRPGRWEFQYNIFEKLGPAPEQRS